MTHDNKQGRDHQRGSQSLPTQQQLDADRFQSEGNRPHQQGQEPQHQQEGQPSQLAKTCSTNPDDVEADCACDEAPGEPTNKQPRKSH